MRKQRIRLTEHDLHNIVKESARQIISELDWRTYDSAADKALGRGETQRAKRFDKAANNAFKRKYGLDMKSNRNQEDEYVRLIKAPNLKNVYGYGNWDVVDRGDIDWWAAPKCPSREDMGDSEMDIDYNEPIEDDNYQDARKEMDNYLWNGENEYEKGKGWKNYKRQNESLNRIVRESINRVLRRR